MDELIEQNPPCYLRQQSLVGSMAAEARFLRELACLTMLVLLIHPQMFTENWVFGLARCRHALSEYLGLIMA